FLPNTSQPETVFWRREFPSVARSQREKRSRSRSKRPECHWISLSVQQRSHWQASSRSTIPPRTSQTKYLIRASRPGWRFCARLRRPIPPCRWHHKKLESERPRSADGKCTSQGGFAPPLRYGFCPNRAPRRLAQFRSKHADESPHGRFR